MSIENIEKYGLIGKKAHVRHISLEGKRTIVTADVHGNLEYLQGLLEKVGYSEQDRLIVVGDLLEKGLRSLDTLRYVLELSKMGEVHLLAGNNDWWWPILQSIDEGDTGNCMWYVNHKPHNLARQMCEEIGYPVFEGMDLLDMRETLIKAFPEEFQLLKNMAEVVKAPGFVFVHGGLPEGDEGSWKAWDCMKYDNFLNADDRVFEPWVVVGHWPVMLYHEKYVEASPVVCERRRVISIDGGCVLKDDGQLNAMIIAPDGSFIFDWYDPFPTATVLEGQAESCDSAYIRWGDNRVQVLERGEEFSRCRHVRTGYEMDILTKYIYSAEEFTKVNDCSDYVLPLQVGDTVSIVEETSRGFYVKHEGRSGWYFGKLERHGSI